MWSTFNWKHIIILLIAGILIAFFVYKNSSLEKNSSSHNRIPDEDILMGEELDAYINSLPAEDVSEETRDGRGVSEETRAKDIEAALGNQ